MKTSPEFVQDLLPVNDSGENKITVLNSIEKYSYLHRPGNAEVWKTGKSKVRIQVMLHAYSFVEKYLS